MGPRGGIPLAAGDDDDDEDTPGIIPGYDITFLLMAIAFSSVIIILKRRKIIELFKK